MASRPHREVRPGGTVTGQARRLRVALLVRVSTRDQFLSEQFRALRQEAERRQWAVVAVYKERESTRRDRPQLRRLMADGLMRRWDALLVLRLDRLGRSLIETFTNVQRLHDRGVKVASVRDGALDTSTASGQLQIAMLCACAAYEREVIRERTVEGLRRVRRTGSASGRPIGRPRSVGWDEAKAAAWFAEGVAAAEIARRLKVSERTARRYLGSLTGKKGSSNKAPASPAPIGAEVYGQ